jgi:hypothetical protein
MKKVLVLGLVVFGVLLVGGLFALEFAVDPVGASPALSPGVDLVIESITVEPSIPDVGEPCTITVVIKNQGSTASGGFYYYLYIDPADRPPTLNTVATSWGYFFGLNPGESMTYRYAGHEFPSLDCDHIVYAWVDRNNLVSEDDETNNLGSTEVCVGGPPTPTVTPTFTPTPTPTPCVPDDYEPDDACTEAEDIDTEGTHQIHNLCPVGDEDWVQFAARAGITYTIETSAVGADGDTVLALYPACGQPPIATDDPATARAARIVWPCTISGLYSVKVNHADADYGGETGYDLSITASTDCPGDVYERDDSCAAARDITSDGVSQSHLFCAAEDYDWVKFNATSGSTVIINTDRLGVKANPVLSIYDACDQPASTGHYKELKWISPLDQIYYVEVRNQAPGDYGPQANYDLSVTTLGCKGDDYEFGGGDDSQSIARLVGVNDPPKTHNICGEPAPDEDWIKFDGRAGVLYVIETFNLGIDADTYMCLYDTDGTTQIICDDDGTGTRAARIIRSVSTDGTYYVMVRHYNPAASGPTTNYDLAVSAGLRNDGFEPDDSYQRASPISTNGVTQTHNFTPEEDDDWIKFSANAGQYAIQTRNLRSGCDTVLQLYDTDGKTLLAQNDDFAFGLGSQVTYTFSSPGTYYARVHGYRSSRFGSNMQYELLVVEGTAPPVPTPTPIPTPTPPPSPPASSVKTLILVNRERMRTLYGAAQANQLMGKLYTLASHPRVLGNIVQVELDSSAAAAYAAWIADPLDTTKANDVASAVRNLVLSYLDQSPNVEHIVIVGNDQVIPFRRTLDRTGHPERYYQAFVSYNTTIWAACGDDMSLTDNYYADRVPTDLSGHELYIPDYAVGRLIETPDEIIDLIDLFLASSTLQPAKALVTGYDFIQDVAGVMCDVLKSDLGDGNVDCGLIGETWNGGQLRSKQFDTDPRFDIQSINGHAGRAVQGAPQTPNVGASEVATWGKSDLSRALIYTLGCHSGLNDVGSLPGGLDLAQAYAQRGASYVANTGYGWGLKNDIGLSEQLMYNYVSELMRGSSTTIGQALAKAKQRYYAEASTFGDYDEKILIESTLYGLPMYQIQTGAALEEDPFPSVVVTSALSLASDGLVMDRLQLGLSGSFASLGENETGEGTYFDLDGHVHAVPGEPIQPKFYADLSMSGAGRAHGVIFTGGTYTDTGTFDPVVVQAVNEYVTPTTEPGFTAPGWYPAVPFALQMRDTLSGTQTLLAALGQYNGATGVERIYDRMSFDVYSSSSYDWWEPIILSVDGVLSGSNAQIKVEAIDGSDIHRVVIVYTDGTGTQISGDLTYDGQTHKWKGVIPATQNTVFYIQVVDGAGNVATADNKGAWYALEQMERGPSKAYLPIVLKRG